MQIKEVMSKKPHCLTPNTLVKQAAADMLKKDFGFLPVCENDKIFGIVTDRDIAIRAFTSKKEADQITLSDIMSKKVVTCHENDNVEEAVKLMKDKKVRRLIVLDLRDKVAGVVSLGDIATKCDNPNMNHEVLHAVSEKSH